MSGLDLSAAGVAGARAITDSMRGRTWLSRSALDVADAAITAAAPLIEAQVREQVAGDVDGIATVLETHRMAPHDEHPDWTCRCGAVLAYAGLRLDIKALIQRHQAEAVAGYLRGQS